MRNALLLAVAASFASPIAMAEGISYSYLDARYFSTDSDAVNANQSGGIIAGSLALGPNLYVAAEGQYREGDDVAVGTSSGSFDTIFASARLGAHYPITPVLDILLEGGALYGDEQGKGAFNGSDDSDVGYIAQSGLRLTLIPRIEVGVFGGYSDVLDSADSFIKFDLQFHVIPQLSLVASASNANRLDTYAFGARYHF